MEGSIYVILMYNKQLIIYMQIFQMKNMYFNRLSIISFNHVRYVRSNDIQTLIYQCLKGFQKSESSKVYDFHGEFH